MGKLSWKLCRSSKLNIVDEQKIVSTRTKRPAHFLFKIDQFTKLEEFFIESFDADNYESPEFKCGGYKWKLSLYPNGNKKLGGDGYISLYLVSAETWIDSLESDGIYAIFKLFIFDQIRETYFTIQDDEVRRFHSMRKEWGFPRMISRKAFKNVENGYLVDDCCVFGMEILVIPPVAKCASFSFIKPPCSGRYTWNIEKHKSLTDKISSSDPFTVEDIQWKLLMCPTQDAKGILFYLVLHESHKSSKVYVECSLKGYCIIIKSDGWVDGSHGLCIGDGTKLRDTRTLEVTIKIICKLTTTT